MTKDCFRRDGGIFEIHGTDPAAMAGELLRAAVGEALPPEARISLKPNLVVSRPAAEGATTHPEILAGIIEYFRERGHRNIEIIEGSWLGDDTKRAFAACGMNALSRRYGVPLHDLKRNETVPMESPAGTIHVCRRALETDFLINIPVMKGHCQTRMTCALKNMKGCLPDTEKRRFHRDGLDECIAALAAVIVPQVSIVDGMCGDLDFEEGGNPVQANRMLLGTDPVKLDAYVCGLMGLPVKSVGYIGLAERYGVGCATVGPDDVTRLNEPGPYPVPQPSGKVRELSRHLEARQACSACYANAIHALKRLEERDGLRGLPTIRIGQGWRGQTVDGLGVGRCCAGAEENVPGCPPSALAIVDAIRRCMTP